ncbi:hypothetical protein Lesp02_06920 [Lentzea sp. NBRC 105346]|nr:hypothetical protein Lesp02_06920 [Lentzea sp. NBRC 105346]
MLISGRPIGAPSVSGELMVAQTVVSVGPYALIIRRPGAHADTTSAGQASPATTRHSRPSGVSPVNATGGRVACVTPRNASARSSPINLWSDSTSVAPESNAMQISHHAASKLNDANCNTRLSAVTPR